MLENDRALLDAYRRHDRQALDRIYRFFSPIVLRHLCKQGVRAIDLEAAHQEAFIRVFADAARMQYDGLRPFEPYVLSIARFAAIDVLRAQGKVHAQRVPLDELAVADSADLPDELLLVAEARALVRTFLATLSEADRRFATVRFVEGLSQEKAGEVCSLTRQEARTREAKLKGRCLDFFSAKGWPDPVLALLVLALVFRG